MFMFFGALAAPLVLNGCAGLVSSANTTSSPPLAVDITNVQATSTTTSTSQINWTTNVPANSVVDYGITTSYGTRTPVDSTMVKNHQVTLSGLTAGTTYYYQVSSTDTKNNNASRGGNPFKTKGYGISGTISPLAGGSGSSLTLTGATSATTAADNSGNYVFTALPTGTYVITPSHAGYTFTPSSQTVTVNGGNIAGVNFTANAMAAPMITTQPVGQTVTAGQTATFMVVATGTAPLSYQWQKNGTGILGASSSTYTTPITTGSDNGAQFTVVVSNSAGSVTSSAATLTVNAATFLLNANPTTVSFGNVNTGSTSSLPVTLTNSGNSNVSVSNISVSGAGFNAGGVSSGTTLTPGQTATLNVTFAPSAAGTFSGSVAVTSNATNSPATVSLSGTGVQPGAAFPVWVSPGLLRVGKTDAPGTTSSINLFSARGETVDSQVIVQGPPGGLTSVNLSASALTGPSGATIPASNITLYREYYITVTGTASYGGGSNAPLGSGTYAEPLIPFNDPETGATLCGSSATLKACNANINAVQDQPYWIDISVPRGVTNSPPGIYTGAISITTTQGNATVPVSLTVWNFELPMQPSELSLWTLWPPASGNTTTTLAKALMRNKLMSWYDVAANASTDISNLGLNRSGLDSYYFIGIQCNGSFSSMPSTSQINSAAANFPVGLGLDFYLADELNGCTGAYSALKTMGTNAHAANRSVKTMMTTNATDPNLYNEGDGRSAIDHWVLLDSMEQWPTLPFTGGGDLWSYTSCNTGFGNTPEWMVDYPPINERIQAGFLNWTQGATGILYYRADGWTAGNAIGSWNNVDTTGCGGGLGRPGDGIFLYPPGPIASTESAPGIRLKAIRDGIQDYEYAQILKNLGQVPTLNSVVVPIATSWTNWSHDANALENARQQLGQLLNQLAP